MLGSLKLLRIVALVPLVADIGKSEAAVVRTPGQRPRGVGPVAGLEPPPVAGLVHSDAKAKVALAGFSRPGPDDVAVRSQVGGVPGMVFGIPGVKTVVMVGEGHKIAGAGL